MPVNIRELLSVLGKLDLGTRSKIVLVYVYLINYFDFFENKTSYKKTSFYIFDLFSHVG